MPATLPHQAMMAIGPEPFMFLGAILCVVLVLASIALYRNRSRAPPVITDDEEFRILRQQAQVPDMVYGSGNVQPVQPDGGKHPALKRLGFWKKAPAFDSDTVAVPETNSAPHLMDFCKSEKLDVAGPSVPAPEYLGRINFRIGFDSNKDVFVLHIIECVDLPAMDLNGFSDPYVKVFLLPDKKDVLSTRVFRRTRNPYFNEILYVPLPPSGTRRKGSSYAKGPHRNLSLTDRRGIISPGIRGSSLGAVTMLNRRHIGRHMEDMTMGMQVMDRDRFSRDDMIGEVLLPIKNVKVENSPVYWKHLQKPTSHKPPVGELMLSLCYLPAANKITVVVIKAKGLPKKDMLGTSDPYVKLALYQGNQKIHKMKTSVKSQSLSPVYNESFAFNAPPKDKLQTEVNLVLTVNDYDMIGTNEEIGQAAIGPMTGDHGQKHWKEMLDNPEHPTAMWHKLVPKQPLK